MNRDDLGMQLPPSVSLVREAEGLTLKGDGLCLRGDFHHLLPRIRPDNLNRELLVRAAKFRGLDPDRMLALDATAGLGEDSFLLAAAGFTVDLYEQDPVIAALLADALARADEDAVLRDIVRRMRFHEGDSVQAMQKIDREHAPAVIYLDPMFPERRKSASVKKKFQLLHRLERPCGEEEELLRAAIGAGPGRVIIKRPGKGPVLAGVRPSYTLAGRAVRMDVIVPCEGGMK
ncbi:MAG: class I SAM-dependent methyltransferase [Lachnospiraceae bacterium]|nr:class I SAM-dependent methyltransferase [Lachnospiraceae bacterium]